jgi:hypothetical protein
MRIHRAYRNARVLDAPPATECIDHGSAGSDHALGRQQRWNIPKGHVRRHENHPKRVAVRIVRHALRGEHHGDIDIAGEVRQPLGMTRVGKACEVKGVLVSWGGDDGVYFSAEREPDCGLHGVAGDAARADDAVTILIGVSTP